MVRVLKPLYVGRRWGACRIVTTYDPMVRVLKQWEEMQQEIIRVGVTTYDPMVRVLKPSMSTDPVFCFNSCYNLRPDGEGTETISQLTKVAYDSDGYNLRPDGEGTETHICLESLITIITSYNLRPDGEGTETYHNRQDAKRFRGCYNLRPDGEGTET